MDGDRPVEPAETPTGFRPDELAVISEPRSDSVVGLALVGDFDLSGVPTFLEEVTAVLGDGVSRVEVDASNATFADSSALKALVTAHRDAATAGAELWVTASSEALDRVLDMTGLRQLLCERP
jgi:anti-sigma B factor antagonist